MVRPTCAMLFASFVFFACGAQPGDVTPAPPTAVETTSPAPTDEVPPRPVAIPQIAPAANISLPEGFSAYAIATGFFRPTSIALAGDGAVYVSLRDGRVERIADADGDGFFESGTTFAETPGEITGVLAAGDGGLYISATGTLLLASDTDGDGISDSEGKVVSALPHGRHQNNGAVLGPDGKLYLTIGTTCDDCDEPDERSGTILQANPDGSDVRVFATGLRNPYDLGFDARGRLWATDNGSDEPCATVDELDLIVDSGDYGWPYGADGCDPLRDGTPPIASLGLHTAATGIASYDAAQFPKAYRGDLLITLWGSFFAEPELPPQLLRATIEEGEGEPRATVRPFASGFQHPIDVVVDHDGTLLLLDYGEGGADDTSGTLYRLVYTD